MPGAIFCIADALLAVRALEIAVRLKSPRYVSESVVDPMRLKIKLKGKTFAHQTSCPCVSATIRSAPALRKVEDIQPKGAAAPNATVLIPCWLTILATARLTRGVGNNIFALSLMTSTPKSRSHWAS